MSPKGEPETALILLAGGSSERFGEENKLLTDLRGRPVVDHLFCTIAELNHRFDEIVLVDGTPENMVAERVPDRLQPVKVVESGSSRHESVENGLNALTGEGVVLIHDCARPLASLDLWQRVLSEHDSGLGVVPVVRSPDSLLRAAETGVSEYLDRSHVRCVQTPQRFPLTALRRAFAEAPGEYPDEGSRWLEAGHGLKTVAGERGNIKLTWPEDLALLHALSGEEQQ